MHHEDNEPRHFDRPSDDARSELDLMDLRLAEADDQMALEAQYLTNPELEQGEWPYLNTFPG